MDHIKSLIINSYIKSFFEKKDTYNILEPITTLLKICLLKYHTIGTKLSVKDNKLSLIKPSLVQGYIRWENGDNRNDLHNLYVPLIKVIEWDYFNVPKDAVIKIAINGLLNLKKTYEDNSIIQYTIDHFINIMKGKDINNDDLPPIINTYDGLSNIMINMWNENQLDIVFKIILEIDITKDIELQNTLINSLNIILNDKEERVCNLLKKK